MSWIYVCYVEESRLPLWSSGQSSWLQNGDVLCFLWGTSWIYICHVEESRLLLWYSGQSSWLQNGDVLCFLWGMNWIYICYVEESRLLCGLVARVPGYRSTGPGFDLRRYHIFWEVVSLEQGPLSLVSTIEELLERKCSGSGLEIWEYGRRDLSRWPRGTLYLQKLALASPTNSGRSVGIVRSWTQAMEFFHYIFSINCTQFAMNFYGTHVFSVKTRAAASLDYVLGSAEVFWICKEQFLIPLPWTEQCVSNLNPKRTVSF
jgi:hypothetical protein